MDHHTHSIAGPRELQMARSMCWHCQSEVAGEYFCDRCVKVQPVSKDLDYFTCLGFPRRLMIDQHQLDSIARYVLWTRKPQNSGGWGIENIGPIPEGIVAWFIALTAMVIVARLIGERTA